jgi:hypothetical protein
MEDVLLEMSSVDSDVLIEISYLEIYNEEVYDLLTCQPTKLIVQGKFVGTCKFRLEGLGI